MRQPKLANQLERRGLGSQEAIGAAFNRAAANMIGLENTATARAALDDSYVCPALLQFECSGETRDSTANDNGAHSATLGPELAHHLHDRAHVFNRCLG